MSARRFLRAPRPVLLAVLLAASTLALFPQADKKASRTVINTDPVPNTVADRTKQNVRLVSKVDPSLLGGFVVSVGSARLDASLARRLEKARAALHALAPA